MKNVYVLKSDLLDLGEYAVFGVYQSKEELLQAVEDYISQNFEEFEEYQDQYDFSGFICVEIDLNKTAKQTDGFGIKWNAEKCRAEFNY